MTAHPLKEGRADFINGRVRSRPTHQSADAAVDGPARLASCLPEVYFFRGACSPFLGFAVLSTTTPVPKTIPVDPGLTNSNRACDLCHLA